jgi:hypothetical protein
MEEDEGYSIWQTENRQSKSAPMVSKSIGGSKVTLICPNCGKEVFLSLTSGDEPPTTAQLNLIKKLADERHSIINLPKTKAGASIIIDQLIGKGGVK